MVSDNINTTKTFLQKSLTRAVKDISWKFASLLLDLNKDLEVSYIPGNDQCTYLHSALYECRHNSDIKNMVKVLLLHGASVDAPNQDGLTLLEISIKLCDFETFKLLWESPQAVHYYHSLDLKTWIQKTNSLLHCAINSDHHSVAKILLWEMLDCDLSPDTLWMQLTVEQGKQMSNTLFQELAGRAEEKYW